MLTCASRFRSLQVMAAQKALTLDEISVILHKKERICWHDCERVAASHKLMEAVRGIRKAKWNDEAAALAAMVNAVTYARQCTRAERELAMTFAWKLADYFRDDSADPEFYTDRDTKQTALYGAAKEMQVMNQVAGVKSETSSDAKVQPSSSAPAQQPKKALP
jgi:hypothetical protein